MACGALTCDEAQDIGLQQLMRRLVRKSADGCPALSLSPVIASDPCTPFLQCDPSLPGGMQLSWVQLLRLLTGTNSNGCLSIRTVITGANCALGLLDYGVIHCNEQALNLFNPYGDMTYLGYNYVHEYQRSDNPGVWVVFGGNTNYQPIEALPDFGTPDLYTFRTHIRCNAEDIYFRTVLYDNAGAPFKNFLQVIVNGGAPQHLKTTTEGVNYFCSTDTLRFIQPNTEYTTAVNGPGSADWADEDHTWLPVDALPDGIYDATFTDQSIRACNGQKSFEIVRMPAPVIVGDIALCAGDTSILDAGPGYDSYLWSTGATTQTITVSTAGTYTVTVRRTNTPGCALSDSVNVTVAPAVDPIITDKDTDCVEKISNSEYTMIPGDIWTLSVQDYGVGATYDFGFGPGPDNFFEVNGPDLINIIVTLPGGCQATLQVLVNPNDNNTTTVDTQTAPGPPCSWQIQITDPNVIQANVDVTVFGNNSGFIGNFLNTLTINFTLDPADTSWSAIMSAAPGVDGCLQTFLKLDITCI